MHVLDAILFGLLVIGNGLALPVWRWLFGTPIVRIWKRRPNRRRGNPTDHPVVVSW